MNPNDFSHWSWHLSDSMKDARRRRRWALFHKWKWPVILIALAFATNWPWH